MTRPSLWTSPRATTRALAVSPLPMATRRYTSGKTRAPNRRQPTPATFTTLPLPTTPTSPGCKREPPRTNNCAQPFQFEFAPKGPIIAAALLMKSCCTRARPFEALLLGAHPGHTAGPRLSEPQRPRSVAGGRHVPAALLASYALRLREPRSGVLFVALLWALAGSAAESPYLYGIHDHSPDPTEYLNHIKNATGAGGWITATVALGADTNNFASDNFSTLANAGHTIICRLNYGYFPDGTIPVPSKYDAFATRCKNYVANSAGCNIWLIGNELNLSAEWPFDGARFTYVSPQDYANCFRKAYNAIKSVRPNDKVIPQASAPWGGPYGAGTQNVGGMNYPSDGQPLSWVQYKNQVLSAITNSGPLDGIALHIGSRGYHYADIHSTNKISAGGQNLYFSFYVDRKRKRL